MANYIHEDHPEGPVTVEKPFPQALRDQVVLNFYDSEIKDGDSNAACSFKLGEHEGEIFEDRNSDSFFEVYPHDPDTEPMLVERLDRSIPEEDFLKDAVLQTIGLTTE